MTENNENKQNNEPENEGKKLFLFIAIVLIVAGAVALGLYFTALGIYALVASAVLEFAAMICTNVQKKINDLKWLKFVKLAAYAVFFAAVAVIVLRSVF